MSDYIGGAFWLDFVWCLMAHAIRDRRPDDAYRYARELAHWWRALRFNDLVELQEIRDKAAAQ